MANDKMTYLDSLMEPLVGGIVEVAKEVPDQEFGRVPLLVVKCKDGVTRQVFILCDEEGNGAGHPHIQE